MIAWIGVIGTLLGAILGGTFALISARIQQRYQTERDRNKLILSKLEELFTVLGQYRVAAASDVVKSSRMIVGDIMKEQPELFKPNLPVELTIDKEVEMPPKEKIDILVGFYAIELADHYDKFMNCFVAYGNARASIIRLDLFQNTEEAKRNAVVQLMLNQQEFDKACQSMQAQIIHVARKYI